MRSIATIDNLSTAYPIALRQVYFSGKKKLRKFNKNIYRHYYIKNSIKVASLTCKLSFLSGIQNGLVPDQA